MLENLNDALIDLVKICGGSKVVGLQMRPELSADDAGKWLRDCLNPDRREKLAPEQLVWLLRLGRERGHHDAMNFIGQDIGYDVTAAQRVTPQERLLAALEHHNEVGDAIAKQLATLTASNAQPRARRA